MLTDEQSKVAQQALSSLLETDERCALIKGSAGTGKSYVASQLFNMLPAGYTVTFLAYTNKAVYNLEKMLFESGLGLQCDVSTIHRFLKLSKESIDQKTGKRVFKKNSSNYHVDDVNPETHLLCIDEVGTVPNNDEAPLVFELMALDNPLLGLGDEFQLPPPKEKIGSFFQLLADTSYELKEVIRYKGGLLQAATDIRDRIHSPFAPSVLNTDNHNGEEGVFKLQPIKLRKTIDRYVQNGAFLDNPDSFRVLTWRKRAMDFWNDYIRVAIYGSDLAKCRFLPGERIIAMESCIGKQQVTVNYSTFLKKVKLLSASQEATIIEVGAGSETINKTPFEYYILTVLTDLGAQVDLIVLHEGYQKDFDNLCKVLASEKRWREYWDLKDFFHDVKPAFSLNIDRCQGITLDNAVLDLEDVMGCRDIWHRNRVLYTMLTRCRKAAYV